LQTRTRITPLLFVLLTLSPGVAFSKDSKDTKETTSAAESPSSPAPAKNFHWLSFEFGPVAYYQSTSSYFVSGSLAWAPRWNHKVLGLFIEPRLEANVAKDVYFSSLWWGGSLGADFRLPLGATENWYVALGGACGASYQPGSTSFALFPQASGVVGYKLTEGRTGVLGLLDRVYVRYGADFTSTFMNQISIGLGVKR